MAQFVYFDLDDTLLDHQHAEQQALRATHAHFQLSDFCRPEQLIKVYHSVNSTQWEQYAEGKIDRTTLQSNRFTNTLQQLQINCITPKAFGEFYMRWYAQHWQWVDGAQKAFDHIRQRFDVGILTNGFAETQKKKFTQFNFYDTAQALIISEEVGALKPDPKVFNAATKQAGCTPDDILYVGDSFTSDVVGGKNAGWSVAWFTQNGTKNQHAEADFVFSDFNELLSFLGDE